MKSTHYRLEAVDDVLIDTGEDRLILYKLTEAVKDLVTMEELTPIMKDTVVLEKNGEIVENPCEGDMQPLDFVVSEDKQYLYMFDAGCDRGRIFYYQKHYEQDGKKKWIETDSVNFTFHGESEEVELSSHEDYLFIQYNDGQHSHIYQTEFTSRKQRVVQEYMNPEECKFIELVSSEVYSAAVCEIDEYEYLVKVFVNDQNSYSNLYDSKKLSLRPRLVFVENSQLYAITQENVYTFDLNEEHPFEAQANVWAKVTVRLHDAVNTDSFSIPVTVAAKDKEDQHEETVVTVLMQ